MGTEAVGWALRQSIADPMAKLVLIGLADIFHDKTGECFPSKATLLEVAPCSEDCLKKKLRLLEKEGWVKRVTRFESNGRQTTNSYEIVFERGITREEYARQQAEKRAAKQARRVLGRGDQKSPTQSTEGSDQKSPRGVTDDTPRGVTQNPPLTTTNEQESASRENISSKRWEDRLRSYRARLHQRHPRPWPANWGPLPGDQGCLVPVELIRKHEADKRLQ